MDEHVFCGLVGVGVCLLMIVNLAMYRFFISNIVAFIIQGFVQDTE